QLAVGRLDDDRRILEVEVVEGQTDRKAPIREDPVREDRVAKRPIVDRDPCLCVVRDQVTGAGGGPADRVVARTAFDVDASLVVGQGYGSGDVRPDLIAGDHVAIRTGIRDGNPK